MTTQLARKRLDELEGVIDRGLQTFVNVGNALREIKDDDLYTTEYDTFDAYCKARWGWSSPELCVKVFEEAPRSCFYAA